MKDKKEGTWSFLFKYGKKKKYYFFLSIFFALIKVACEIIPYMMLPEIITNLIEGNVDIKFYLVRLLIMLALLIASLVFKYISTSLSHIATFHCLANMREDMLLKLSKMSLGDIENISLGTLKNIIVERVDSVETTLAHVIPEATSNALGSLTLIIYLFAFVDYRLGFAGLISVVLGGIFASFMYFGYQKWFKNAVDKTKALNDTAVDYINGIEVIKIFGKEKESYSKFKKAAHDGAYCFIDWQKHCNLWFSIGLVLAPSILFGILPIGGLMLYNNQITLTTFIISIITAIAAIYPLLVLMTYQDDLAKIGTITNECKVILSNKELVRPTKLDSEIKGSEIELKDVTFAYEDKNVINDVNLKIKEGEFIALTGPSGAGKSTLAKLIASYYDPQKGSVTLGGVNLKDIPLDIYNKYISYVGQNNYLFNMSILDNIRIAKENATDEEIIDICKKCGCHEFITSLENGYNTIVGSKGGHLSGGERQRITIARAMLKDAPIVILDEATAYTDPENETVIEKAISSLVKGKTLIVIAHRLSTIVNANRILVVNKGKIQECGTHQELLNKKGLYEKMWNTHISYRDEVESC